MSFELVILTILGALGGLVAMVAGFLGGKLKALQEKLEESIANSPSKLDDEVLKMLKDFLAKVIEEKNKPVA